MSNNEDTSSHPRAVKCRYTEVSPEIFVPDSQAGPSNSRQVVPAPIRVNDQWYDDDNNELCLEVLEHVQNA